MPHRLTMEDKELILELYKCHYTAKETAKMLFFGYGTIVPYFRAFDLVNVKQYNRKINNDATYRQGVSE